MLPLTGVRILSVALNAPGPLACARLAADGARVVKIEPPGGDPMKHICRSWYDEMHRLVDVEELNLKDDTGRVRMQTLLRDTDVFVSSQRPAALARLGLGPEGLAGVRSVNIVGDVTEPEVPGHDLTYLARAGLLGAEMPLTLAADVMGSERAYAAVLLVLRQPIGAHIDVGLFDSLSPLIAPLAHGLTRPGAVLGGGLPAYGVYETKSGRIAIGALEPHFRMALYEALDRPLDSNLGDIMRTRTAAEWEDWARQRDLPLSRVIEPLNL
jgi:alpha-methylacyl-CoA racemase